VPKETDPAQIALLLRLLSDPASNVVIVGQRAFEGSSEADDLGLDRLLADDLQPREKAEQLKVALAEFLGEGGAPNRVAVAGDAGRGDPAVFYEFRLTFAGVKVYVKSELKDDDPADPVLEIKSVKRQN
jgi:hypothetical protein